LSFNKKVCFPEGLKGFKVRSVTQPPVPIAKVQEDLNRKLEEGKKSASDFYSNEINQLKQEFVAHQHKILEQLNSGVEQTLSQLNDNLPNLVMEIVEKIIPGIEIGALEIDKIIRALISEFADEDEHLEVFLCPDDLKLLKAMGKKPSNQKNEAIEPSESGDGFASAIAGIFDNLDGEDAVLPDLPRVKFFEDASLSKGDCQVKSKFGLLDGRIATKIRKVNEELTGSD
jgi:flagellar biosynthesis/type III secretory pathway protein FliH